MQMPSTIVSPHYGPEKLRDPTFKDLVDIFEDRIKFWLLEPAQALLDRQSGQVAALCLLLTYFEGVWSYMRGEDSNNRSKRFFKESFAHVFRSCGQSPALLRKIADVLYEDARCGFFHDGLFRDRVFFGNLPTGCLSITLPMKDGLPDESGAIESLVVDVQEFYKYVDGHFTSLVASLRDNAPEEAKERFQRSCTRKWNYSGAPRVIAL